MIKQILRNVFDWIKIVSFVIAYMALFFGAIFFLYWLEKVRFIY